MAKKESFLHKLNFKYKLTILNENTLEEAWHIRLSRIQVILFCFAIAVLYFLIIAFLIMRTPLRTFLPGYTDIIELESKVRTQALVVDSLQEMATQNQLYLDMLHRVVCGEVETKDSNAVLSDLVNVELEKVKMDPTERENSFCSKYEIDQRYSTDFKVTSLSQRMVMHRPSLGVVTKSYDSSIERYGVSLAVDPMASIYSVLDGHVIFTGYSAHNRYCIQIQHEENLVSTYKFTQPFFKNIGDNVHAGEILATLRENETQEMTFELWLSGRPLNPQEYISFSTGKVIKDESANKRKAKYQVSPVDLNNSVQPKKPAPVPVEKSESKPAGEAPAQPKKETPAVESAPVQSAPAPSTKEVAVPAPAPAPQAVPAPAPAPAPAE